MTVHYTVHIGFAPSFLHDRNCSRKYHYQKYMSPPNISEISFILDMIRSLYLDHGVSVMWLNILHTFCMCIHIHLSMYKILDKSYLNLFGKSKYSKGTFFATFPQTHNTPTLSITAKKLCVSYVRYQSNFM